MAYLDKKRRLKAETIMGEGGVEMQERRARQAMQTAREQGKSPELASAREAAKRVGEYKKRRPVKQVAQDYRPPNHGKRKR
jgi:hypothetical protein